MRYNNIITEQLDMKNHEGEQTYEMSAEMMLYSAVVTSLVCDTFYESSNDRLKRIADLIRIVDPVFVAQLAIYAREEMHLRSIPLFLIVELAKVHNGDRLVSNTIARVVQRADEIMELLACYQLQNPDRSGYKRLNRLSRQIQNGLKQAFNNFDEYQFGKYNRNNAAVKLKDALFLVHPKAKSSEQQEIFNKIASDNLEVPYTWETELSMLGQKAFDYQEEKNKALRECWEGLIESGRLGYMALLRNLRNILSAGLDSYTLKIVCDTISSEHAVKKSKQLPFRFYAAYQEICKIETPNTHLIIDALEKAVVHSVNNIAHFDANTSVLLACDVSGSMTKRISTQSKIMNYDIGILLASALRQKCSRVITGIFGDIWHPSEGGPRYPILRNTTAMHSNINKVGYSTNGYKVIDWLISLNIKMDKIMFFTDMQMWDSTASGSHLERSWIRYKQLYPNAQLYLFDLNGYGQAPIKVENNDVTLIAGWSEKIFDLLDAIKNGKTAIDVIKNITI